MFLDALPYVDNDLAQHPELAAKVEAEIVKELKASPPPNPETDTRLAPEFQLFAKNPSLAVELQRVQSNETLSALDTTRYKLPDPVNTADEAEWEKALANAKAQLEHQRMRQANLGLLQTYGANAWRVHNYLLEASSKQYEDSLQQIQDQVTEVNRNRKNSQTLTGNQLASLEARWVELVSTVLQIELANVALEGEIDDLTRQAEAIGA